MVRVTEIWGHNHPIMKEMVLTRDFQSSAVAWPHFTRVCHFFNSSRSKITNIKKNEYSLRSCILMMNKMSLAVTQLYRVLVYIEMQTDLWLDQFMLSVHTGAANKPCAFFKSPYLH